MQSAKRALRYFHSSMNFGLKFLESTSLGLTGYFDTNQVVYHDDRRNVGAYYVFLGNNIVSWTSSKQKIVVKSLAESNIELSSLQLQRLNR